MYRVELKELKEYILCPVLNLVPNVPCGVESKDTLPRSTSLQKFLMYRVELKAMFLTSLYTMRTMFLMYRVELKVEAFVLGASYYYLFLMYRVELKGKPLAHRPEAPRGS